MSSTQTDLLLFVQTDRVCINCCDVSCPFSYSTFTEWEHVVFICWRWRVSGKWLKGICLQQVPAGTWPLEKTPEIQLNLTTLWYTIVHVKSVRALVQSSGTLQNSTGMHVYEGMKEELQVTFLAFIANVCIISGKWRIHSLKILRNIKINVSVSQEELVVNEPNDIQCRFITWPEVDQENCDPVFVVRGCSWHESNCLGEIQFCLIL